MPSIKETKVIRSNRRSLTMQMLPDKTLVVKAPLFLPNFLIDRFINKNSDWIEKKLTRTHQKVIRHFVDGEEFLFMGETVKLKIGDYSSIKVIGNNLCFPEFMKFRIKKELESWYIKKSKEKITELLEKYAKEFKTSYKSVSFSDTSSKWGSCTHDNRLQFCWRLIMAPELVIRYVVVHELAHTLEKNHSRNFWSKVRFVNPSFKQQIKWLKTNGESLVL